MRKAEYLIDARKLKSILLNKSDFSVWIKRNIKRHDFNKNIDFFISQEKLESVKYKTQKINYFLTLEAAEKIILGYSRNEIAKKMKVELEKGRKFKIILEEIENEQKANFKIIEFNDDEYPMLLKKIKNPPKQLYVKGNITNLNEYGIAVIGSRDCSNYGRQVCRSFTKGLAAYNLNIISGLAKGIDACAHNACLEVKGKTIAVLPSGLNNVYPKHNESLLNKIIEKGGTVISEYPPDFEKTSDSCRDRNRIMSALAIGTLVIEAEERSGTSVTVDYTNEQGKKAFCIPSGLLNSKGKGTNKMIKQNRAKIVTEVEDIIKEFPELKLERKSGFEDGRKVKKKKAKIEIDEENFDVYKVLGKEPKHIDEISKLINKPINEITYKLTMLESQGVIKELPSKKFKIID